MNARGKQNISNYILKKEKEERDEVFGLDIVSTSPNSTNPFAKTPCVTSGTGTVYKIAPKGSDDPTLIRTVFIPDGPEYCQSDYYVHTAFLIRCRYIQRALIEHKHRRLNDIDTIHERWHVVNHPLYPKVYNELVQTAKIEGTEISIIDGTSSSDVGQIVAKRKPTGARSESGRYMKTNQVCKKIIDHAKKSQVRNRDLPLNWFHHCMLFTTVTCRNFTTSL